MKMRRNPPRPQTTISNQHSNLRIIKSAVLTADVVDPGSPLHDKDVVQHETKVEGLEHQEYVPSLDHVSIVIRDDYRGDQLRWNDGDAC